MEENRTRERTTFLDVSEIVERTNRYARRARDLLIIGLRGADPIDERTRLFLETLEEQREELEAAMVRTSDEMPARLRETHAQFTVDPWDTEPSPPPCTSIEEAVRWMAELDEQLIQTYQEIADRADNDDATREFFGSLADLVQGFDRRMAWASQVSHDL